MDTIYDTIAPCVEQVYGRGDVFAFERITQKINCCK